MLFPLYPIMQYQKHWFLQKQSVRHSCPRNIFDIMSAKQLQFQRIHTNQMPCQILQHTKRRTGSPLSLIHIYVFKSFKQDCAVTNASDKALPITGTKLLVTNLAVLTVTVSALTATMLCTPKSPTYTVKRRPNAQFTNFFTVFPIWSKCSSGAIAAVKQNAKNIPIRGTRIWDAVCPTTCEAVSYTHLRPLA